jgi:hypothetical protein
MAGAWKPGKTNRRFSPVSPPPWESGKLRRIPTFPQRRLLLPLLKPKRQKQERNRPLRGLRFQILFRIILYWKRYLISGSSDDWKMLEPAGYPMPGRSLEGASARNALTAAA